ncbi:hypothetical protein EZS27_018129 [termite gut metagenome]|jgi:hypothetical protein|uniref:Uncharacterized protein n=1 Tax=termite gut metagenome TaxID=433724 RepID=A0A5J4RKX0_9ZZZZ
MNVDITLYRELIDFCNNNQDIIETKFKRNMEFSELNEACYEEMFQNCRKTTTPPTVKHFKGIIPGLTEAYKTMAPYFFDKRNESIKGLDIQKGQWYEKALQLFLKTKGVFVNKKRFPFPDFEVMIDNKIVGYYELKYIKSPFISANNVIKDTYPYSSTRYDYEASLTLDTGEKIEKQRYKIETDILPQNIPVHYVWWYDCFHIKGIFAMSAAEVFDYYDHLSGDLLQRKEREGDLEVHQEKGKIYPPLLNMNTFSELLRIYQHA